jgi:hypothetical protein
MAKSENPSKPKKVNDSAVKEVGGALSKLFKNITEKVVAANKTPAKPAVKAKTDKAP